MWADSFDLTISDFYMIALGNLDVKKEYMNWNLMGVTEFKFDDKNWDKELK